MVDRVSTLSFQNTNLSYISERLSSLSEINRQISSGKKADSFVDLNGSVEQIVSYENRIARNEAYISNNIVIQSRLNAMNNSVEQLETITSTVLTLTIGGLSTVQNPGAIATLRGELDKVLDNLNIEVAGRFLFSGSRTDVQPIADPPTTLVPGTADASYYQGNSDNLIARVTDNSEITYGVAGDELAFQQLISGINTALDALENAPATGSGTAIAQLGQATDLLNNAKTNLAGVRAGINSNIILVEQATTQLERVNLSFKEALSEQVDTDIAEATIKLSADEVVLQATFSAFSRISSLRLTDFLN